MSFESLLGEEGLRVSDGEWILDCTYCRVLDSSQYKVGKLELPQGGIAWETRLGILARGLVAGSGGLGLLSRLIRHLA